jgi:hypothetical protein
MYDVTFDEEIVDPVIWPSQFYDLAVNICVEFLLVQTPKSFLEIE